jgi:hypothetical protein
MRAAVNEVLKNKPVNVVARAFGIDRMTLKRYVRKRRLNPNENFKPHFNTRQVFTAEDEESLASYLLMASKMNYGLSTTSTCWLLSLPSPMVRFAHQHGWKIKLQASIG